MYDGNNNKDPLDSPIDPCRLILTTVANPDLNPAVKESLRFPVAIFYILLMFS